MGVLYDVLFKPIGRGGDVLTSTRTPDDDSQGDQAPPEWVLDKRDGGSLVWRRDVGVSSPDSRKRVEFLDAVQVREFERDECDVEGSSDEEDDGCFAGFADECSGSAPSEAWADKDDYAVLVVVSVTVVGLCIGFAYLFAPVRWLIHHVLLVDE